MGTKEDNSGRSAVSGDTVSFHYAGTLDDGTVFDSSQGREPMQVTLGLGQLIPGVDEALTGMVVGERKTVTVEPERGYGERREQMVLTVPRDQVPPDVKAGEQLEGPGPDGSSVVLQVTEVTDETVTLDYNHPLAGRSLTFELELVSIGTAGH